MANIKSALKRIKTNEKARKRNSSQKSMMRTIIKKAELAIAENASNAQQLVFNAIKQIDKSASKGVIHKNNAARKKSRLMKKFNQLQA